MGTKTESDDLDEMLFDAESTPHESVDLHMSDSDDGLLDDSIESDTMLWASPFICTESHLTDRTIDQVATLADSSIPSAVPRSREWLITSIEDMIAQIMEDMTDSSRQLTIVLRSRSSRRRQNTQQSELVKGAPPCHFKKITFPASNPHDAWRFAVVLHILELVHSSLFDNVVMTKRDLYYRNPDLFVKQSVVDEYVDDIACTFGVSRSALNISAVAKGLVAGNFRLHTSEGATIHGLNDREGILVPTIHPEDLLDLSAIYWVLVIEKEASFRALLNRPEWQELRKHCLVLTAKGYPDLSSRKFLKNVEKISPGLPIYVLVDHDPDGIAILSTYKYGSVKLAHEHITGQVDIGLELMGVQWLGVRTHDIGDASRHVEDDKPIPIAIAPIATAQGLMKLTVRDRLKAAQLLTWTMCDEHGPEPEWRLELQRMLMLNVKAEIQILDEATGGIGAWVKTQLEKMQGLGADMMGPAAVSASDDELLF